MRVLIIAAAFGLSACGNNDQTDNNMNIDQNLTAENIIANDVTAIDAVTADAANMAADVDINFTNAQLDDDGDSPGNQSAKARPGPRSAPAGDTESHPTDEPAVNQAQNSAEETL